MRNIASWKYLILIAWFGLMYFPRASAQSQVKAAVSVDAYKARIGEQLNLSLSVVDPTGSEISWPLLSDTIGGFEILSRSEIDTVKDAGSISYSQQLTLTSFDSGFYRIPPIAFYTADSTAIFSKAIGINVFTVPVDTAQAYKDIKAPIEAPFTLRDMIPYLLLGLALLAVAAVLIALFYRRKKPAPPVERPRPVIPAHEIAMRKLGLLEEKKLWQQGEVKAYYSELTEILREYLEARYRIPALESTTFEIMGHLQDKPMPAIQMRLLRELLERADLVKFAKFKPEPGSQLQEMETAREFVRRTREQKTESPTPTSEDPQKAPTT